MTQLHFGFWTVLDPTPIARRVLCRCACGLYKRVDVYDLRRGKTQSCRGCAVGRMSAAQRAVAERRVRTVAIRNYDSRHKQVRGGQFRRAA